jgi:pimeloyl-ACP methyl ester carboxylesterase
MDFANAQTLTYFQKGDPNKPLILFIPGDSHLARIAYGYPNLEAKDFLAYWLNQRGYSFLGLSYPLANPVFSKKYPEFNIHQWGEQIVEAADYFLTKNNLPRKIVILGWSMGGSVEQAVYTAAQKKGLELEVFIGLAAVPPMPFVMQSGSFDTNIMNKDKLAVRKQLYPWFLEQLALQNQLNGHTIIPDDLYQAEFIGDIPTALSAEGYYLKSGQFIKNNELTYQDSGVFNFANTPWIALIEDDAPEDAKIALIEPHSWNFIRAEMLYQRYLKGKIKPEQLGTIQELLKKIPDQLKTTVHGTHFFFVGEEGAKNTATQIDILIHRVNSIKEQLSHQGLKADAS